MFQRSDQLETATGQTVLGAESFDQLAETPKTNFSEFFKLTTGDESIRAINLVDIAYLVSTPVSKLGSVNTERPRRKRNLPICLLHNYLILPCSSAQDQSDRLPVKSPKMTQLAHSLSIRKSPMVWLLMLTASTLTTKTGGSAQAHEMTACYCCNQQFLGSVDFSSFGKGDAPARKVAHDGLVSYEILQHRPLFAKFAGYACRQKILGKSVDTFWTGNTYTQTYEYVAVPGAEDCRRTVQTSMCGNNHMILGMSGNLPQCTLLVKKGPEVEQFAFKINKQWLLVETRTAGVCWYGIRRWKENTTDCVKISFIKTKIVSQETLWTNFGERCTKKNETTVLSKSMNSFVMEP